MQKPLAGRRILITRAAEQAPEFAAVLQKKGAEVLSFPVIRIVPPRSWRKVDQAIHQIRRFDWLLFTSANGVSMFLERWKALGKRPSELKRLRIGAIGSKTSAQIRRLGLRVSAVPEEYRAEALARVLGDVRGKRILLARAQKARDVLPKTLRAHGALVTVVTVYRTLQATRLPAEIKKRLLSGQIDVVTFTSSSTVEAFMRQLSPVQKRKLFRRTHAAVIGPITAATLRHRGVVPRIQAKHYTIESLAKAIVEYFSQ